MTRSGGTGTVVGALKELEQCTRVPFRSAALGYTLQAMAAVTVIGGLGLIWLHSGWFWDYRAILAAVVGVLLVAASLFGTGLGLAAPSAIQVLAADPRSPILFLRPFTRDVLHVRERPGGTTGGGEMSVKTQVRQRAEQQVAPCVEGLGPFVAIGAPGERLASLGAARLYVPHDRWQAVVWRLTRAARLVVLEVGETPGSLWELVQTVRALDPRRLMLLVPDARVRPLGYARVRERLGPLLPAPLPEEAAGPAVLFDEAWRPQVCSLEDAKAVRARIESQLADLAAPPSLDVAWKEDPPYAGAAAQAPRAAPSPAPAAAPAVLPSVTGLPLPAGLVAALRRHIALRGLLYWGFLASLVLMGGMWLRWGEGLQDAWLSFVGAVLLWAVLFIVVTYRGFWRWFFVLVGLAAAYVFKIFLVEMDPATGALVGRCLLVVAAGAAAHFVLRASTAGAEALAAEIRRGLPAASRNTALAETVVADLSLAAGPCPSLWLGRHYLLAFCPGITVVRFDDLMWHYALTVKVGMMMLVPLLSVREVRIHARDQSLLRLEVSARELAAVEAALATAAPWAVHGLSQQAMDAWNHDFQEFVRLVDAARTAQQP